MEAAVNDTTVTPNPVESISPSEPWPGVDRPPALKISPARLAQLLSTYEELRARGRSLMASLRASFFEMQTLRQMLRSGEQARPAATGQDHGESGAAPGAVDDGARRLRRQFGMTRREIEVALLLAEGCSNAVVARRLGISPHTARHHTQRVLDKLGVHSRAAAGARLRQ
jgi:DNA-binding CsgD family transcriptional regulator